MTETIQQLEKLLYKINSVQEKKDFIKRELDIANTHAYGLMNLLSIRNDGQEESRINGIEYWHERIKYLTGAYPR